MLDEFEELLKRAMGLDSASIGVSSIERAVNERQSACKLADARLYLERVRASADELQALIEAVVVPETWFFRDREAFRAVERIVRDEWLPAHPFGTLRLLSLPCSTGEEPYSMAMTLFDSGVPASRFRIDAVDISAHALSRAARATYGKNSFRGHDLAFRTRHFESGDDGYRLNEPVRKQVTFLRKNLFDPDFLPGTGNYDIVFCRNVLIYFDRPTQGRAVAVLDRLLSAQGVLFVGPSETALLLSHGFKSAKIPHAFAFRRARFGEEQRASHAGARKPHAFASRSSSSRPRPPAFPEPKSPSAKSPRRNSTRPATAKAKASTQPPAGLDEAARCADEGKLERAVQLCEAHLAAHGPSASALHLLGIISDASGNTSSAAAYYRKALYLEPQHEEALFHLALLLDGRGETTEAKALRARAERALKGRK